VNDTPKPPYVQFELRAVEDRSGSTEAGHYKAKDVIFAIVTPSGTRDRLEKEAEEWLRGIEEGVKQERIPSEWLRAYRHALQMFKESHENPEFGTPVKDWPSISPAQVRMLMDINLRTVEDLAAANEEALARIGMGARALKAKAQAWLDSSAGQGKLASELESLRTKNAELAARDKERDEQLKTLQAQVEALQKAGDSGKK
jgi:hypothetical protein